MMRCFIVTLILFVVSCSAKQNNTMLPVVIETPTTAKSVNPYDSSYLLLAILKDKIRASIQGKNEDVTDSSGLDKFVAQYQPLINSNKILFIGYGSAAKFKIAVSVLKKYGYLKFQMINKPH